MRRANGGVVDTMTNLNQWTYSTNGHPCQIVNNRVCTVFPTVSGYVYSIIKQGSKAKPTYSRTLATEDEAKATVIAYAEILI